MDIQALQHSDRLETEKFGLKILKSDLQRIFETAQRPKSFGLQKLGNNSNLET